MSCLNPFDVQSRHIMTADGHAESLYAGVGARGGQQYVLVHRKWTSCSNEALQQVHMPELYARSNSGISKEKGEMIWNQNMT